MITWYYYHSFFELLDSTKAFHCIGHYHKYLILLDESKDKDQLIKNDIEHLRIMFQHIFDMIREFWIHQSQNNVFPLYKVYIGCSLAMQQLVCTTHTHTHMRTHTHTK